MKNEKIDEFLQLVMEEGKNQSLVSAKTIVNTEMLWKHHVIDSMQMAEKISSSERVLDVGSGAGFPGIIIAIASDADVVLVEPRKKRAEFLRKVVQRLQLNCTVCQCRVLEVYAALKNARERDRDNVKNQDSASVDGVDVYRKTFHDGADQNQFDVITARGVGTLRFLLSHIHHVYKKNSRLLVIKSSNFTEEIKEVNHKGLRLLVSDKKGNYNCENAICTLSHSATVLKEKNGFLLEIKNLSYSSCNL